MRQFLTTLLVVWVAASIAAYFYSEQQHIPRWILIAVLPAFLIEIACYMVPGFVSVRKAFDRLGSKSFRAALLAASALIPYLIASLGAATFTLSSFAMLAGAVMVASFWYAFIRRSIAADLLFLAFMAAIYLSKGFDLYGRPFPHVSLAILGQLMWIRLGLLAVLSLGGMEDAHLGFVPSPSEWRIGVQWYLCFLPVGLALGYLVRFARFQPRHLEWWKFGLLLIGTFLAFLWVVGLAEEFFFRAFLQQLLAREAHSDAVGLALASLLFGLAHLSFGLFPNWRFAVLGGVAGLFYGIAFLKARSVRASMVTHALVITTWRMLFAG